MSSGFEPGKYRAHITNQQMGKTSNDNPQFVLSFKCNFKYDESAPDGEIACPDWERNIFRVITDKTIDYVMEDLESLGFDGDSFAQLDAAHPQCCNFIGMQIDVNCAYETYQGKTREKWSLHREGGGKMDIPGLDSKGIRNLDAMFGKKLKETAKSVRASMSSGEEKAEEKSESAPAERREPVAAGKTTKDDMPF